MRYMTHSMNEQTNTTGTIFIVELSHHGMMHDPTEGASLCWERFVNVTFLSRFCHVFVTFLSRFVTFLSRFLSRAGHVLLGFHHVLTIFLQGLSSRLCQVCLLQ